MRESQCGENIKTAESHAEVGDEGEDSGADVRLKRSHPTQIVSGIGPGKFWECLGQFGGIFRVNINGGSIPLSYSSEVG